MSKYIFAASFTGCLLLTYIANYGRTTRFSWLNLREEIVIGGLIYPFFEELIFRGIIVYTTSSFKYYKYLNALLFGLIHVPNIMIHGKIIGIIQSINAIIMGYLLVDQDSIIKSFLLHSFHNIGLAIVANFYYHILLKHLAIK